MLRIILIIASFPLKPVIRSMRRVLNRIRFEIEFALIAVDDFFFSLTLPFRKVGWWLEDLLPKRRVEVRYVRAVPDDHWTRGMSAPWP